MTNFKVDLIQFRDNSFNIGNKTGKYIQNQPIVKALEQVTKPEIDYINMRAIYKQFAQHLLDELEGLAEGLQLPLKKTAALFSGYDIPKLKAMGCSSIITKDYYIRNYDFSPMFYDGCFSLLQPENAFASAGYNLQAIGRHDGVNNYGLVLGLHFVSNNEFTKGLSAWTSIRMLLDTCTNVNDAVHMLKEIPHSACYNFSLGDRDGNMAVVEVSPEKVIMRRDLALLTCVNHFQDRSLEKKNRSTTEESFKRNEYLQKFKASHLTQKEMFHIFTNKGSPVFFTDYDNFFGTLHTFSYSFKESKIVTSIAQSNEVLEIDFADWVKGKDVSQNNLYGFIEK